MSWCCFIYRSPSSQWESVLVSGVVSNIIDEYRVSLSIVLANGVVFVVSCCRLCLGGCFILLWSSSARRELKNTSFELEQSL